MASTGPDLHGAPYVRRLFDEMAKTYGIVHLLSSLGFAYWWRRRAVLAIPEGARQVGDLMAGGGECLPHLKRRFGAGIDVRLVDFSPAMCRRARAAIVRHGCHGCRVLEADATVAPAGPACFDAVVSTFGLKTLSESELVGLVRALRQMLRPGGTASLLEFSIPRSRLLRLPFKLYVAYYVPLLGWLLLGNPDNYRHLWRYTESFGNCDRLARLLGEHGFSVRAHDYFFGSATHLVATLDERVTEPSLGSPKSGTAP